MNPLPLSVEGQSAKETEDVLHVSAGTFELPVQYLHLVAQPRFRLGLLFTRFEPFLLLSAERDEFRAGRVKLRGKEG